MSNRRNQNNIRGPHSALTDFLAANNISARQIRDNYERRQREAAQAEAEERGENGVGGSAGGGDNEDNDNNDEEEMDVDEVDAMIERARQEQEAERRRDKKAKKSKKMGKTKKKKGKKRGEDEDGDDSNDSDFLAVSYKKAKKLPGQFANCEICEKRFTVTPYSKTGPDGGLLCTPCGKDLDKEVKSEKRKLDKNGVKGSNKKRRNMQSERLDGVVRRGAKSLVQHCLDTVVKHHDDIESFDNMPDHLILAICKLFTKQRIMSSTLFPLFLRPENTRVIVYDCSCKLDIIPMVKQT
jgi:DNA repair protein RAD7